MSSLISFLSPGLPSTRGEDLQMKCLLEMYGLKVKAVMQYIEPVITLFSLAVHSNKWYNLKYRVIYCYACVIHLSHNFYMPTSGYLRH
jgi:hypothetical protein